MTSLPTDLVDPVYPAGPGRSLPVLHRDPGIHGGGGGRRFELTVQRGASQILDGITTPTLGYSGSILGPALQLHRGERTTLHVHNALDEVTTAHWHGLVVPSDADGGPHQPIAPGATWEASFVVDNPAATCWFHPHPHGSTGRQLVSGLAGLLIVEDEGLAPGMLPDTWGVDDLALVLQDKRFLADGRIDYTPGTIDPWAGYAGDHLLVNGRFGPTWQAPRQWVRLRLLNGCNARILALRLSDGAPLLQVAHEGGLLAAPVWRGDLTLAPGERAEVLVDLGGAAAGEERRLLCRTAVGSMGMGMGMGMGTTTEVTALRMRVDLPPQTGALVSPPTRLPAAPAIVAADGAVARTFTLDGGMMGAPFTLNGRSFEIARIDLEVPAAAVERWRFVNRTGMAHPMHVHGVKMSLLSRDGRGPDAHEQGQRDTFLVAPMQTVTMAVQTPPLASPVPLMVHCHNLEHEDGGMMAQFITV